MGVGIRTTPFLVMLILLVLAPASLRLIARRRNLQARSTLMLLPRVLVLHDSTMRCWCLRYVQRMPLILHQVAVVLLGGAGVHGRRPLLLLLAIVELMQACRLLGDVCLVHRGLVVHQVGVVGSEGIGPVSAFSCNMFLLVLDHVQDALVLVLRLQLFD